MADDLTPRLAARLKELRTAAGWSLDVLAQSSGVSRATLSRLEKAEVSPTAEVLGKLAAAHQLTTSRLLAQVEQDAPPVVRADDQPVWTDEATGFRRRSISPPAADLSVEMVEGQLPPMTRIAYDAVPRRGLEHHLWLLAGALTVTVDGVEHALRVGDCVRYRLDGTSAFQTDKDSARYLIAIC